MLISMQVIDVLSHKPITVTVNPDYILRLEEQTTTPSHVRTLVQMRGGGTYASTEDREEILERVRQLDIATQLLVITQNGVIQEIRSNGVNLDAAVIEANELEQDPNTQERFRTHLYRRVGITTWKAPSKK